MGLQALFFYLFAFVAVASAFMVISARNPVHSVLFLILTFINASGLLLLTGAEFLAMILLVVYVGAVAVLFLFVVMMLDIDFAELRAGFVKNFPLGMALAVVLFVELFVGLIVHGSGGVELGKAAGAAVQAADASNIQAIGALLYSRYLFLFEAAGIVLLVAMIGAIVLTHRQRSGVRGQNVSKQNARRPEDATINMQPETGKGVSL